ncbi:AAA family ATPase [Alkaliphilus peptidifermentans]|uniref:DNA-binding transcriptional activator of the SARP family n=1 Tax=Alkaliphilus peptidifermentans DSM 18978 TaxID=1120976 RepID=A0A1G5KYY0_9FIRM|nr:AAA family ATPase [Alkaliphilus peptidifermentans]SCZ05318.1 DNA-binding transcriptional activator of the SARP family [Alkaliphilus peptidifermentans DSM 18978]
MSLIQVKLFNTPTVTKDQVKILFPFRKAEALFYYLLCKKEATRDEMVNLLWGETPEETAKKNLRNAMYQIRKIFDMDIIISPRKSIIMLNPDIQINIDIEAFLKQNKEAIDLYTGEFLQGFSLKDGESFEEWMINTREAYKDMYISLLYNLLDNKSNLSLEKIEYYTKLLINADPFDERAYQILLNQYLVEGVYNKGIDIYNRLAKTLDKEMGIVPDIESQKLFEDLLKARKLKESKINHTSNDFFYGRELELNRLIENHNSFIMGSFNKSIMLIGEAGIGKTVLKDKFFDNIDKNEVFIFSANCYQAEESYFLKPWNSVFMEFANIIKEEAIDIPNVWKNIIAYLFPIFDVDVLYNKMTTIEELDNMQFKLVEDAVQGLFGKLANKKKIILIFEDMQWMDNMSLLLLKHLLLNNKNKRLIVLGTCRNEYAARIDDFITLMSRYNLMETLMLQRFSENQVEEFINSVMPNQLSQELKHKIYEETEGNTFFLVEYLNALKENRNLDEMSVKMQDVIKSRFINLSVNGKKLIDIISVFFDNVSLEILAKALGKDELEVIETIEELQDRYLIKETVVHDEIIYQFTHQKLRDYIYINQSPAKKRLLHNIIGEILEDGLINGKRDITVYSKLIYHFTNSSNLIKALKYKILNTDIYLDFSHELFPIINESYYIKESSLYLSSQQAIEVINEIETSIKEAKYLRPSEEFVKLEIAFFHMKGRYLIREGDYESGLRFILRMIETANENLHHEFLLKGYRQMVYYGIQTHNNELMERYLKMALDLAEENDNRLEKAILLRLKGLNKIMTIDYEAAEEVLQKAIHLFNDISKYDDKYALNIAGVYNYLGEIRRYNMNFSSALKYYDKAMTMCKKMKLSRGLTIFNTNAGQAAFDMGDYERAKNYFKNGLILYNQFDVPWGRAIAEGYMALLYIREGNYKTALENLIRAESYSQQLKSPYEIGLVYRVKAEIKTNMSNNIKLQRVFKNHLAKSLQEYCDKGIYYLEQVNECYEIEILKILKK